MPSFKIAFFALLLEVAAWSGGVLLGDHADGLLLWYLVTAPRTPSSLLQPVRLAIPTSAAKRAFCWGPGLRLQSLGCGSGLFMHLQCMFIACPITRTLLIYVPS